MKSLLDTILSILSIFVYSFPNHFCENDDNNFSATHCEIPVSFSSKSMELIEFAFWSEFNPPMVLHSKFTYLAQGYSTGCSSFFIGSFVSFKGSKKFGIDRSFLVIEQHAAQILGIWDGNYMPVACTVMFRAPKTQRRTATVEQTLQRERSSVLSTFLQQSRVFPDY